MNNVCQVAITAITLNGSVTLPFVIPSEAEGLQFRRPFLEMLMEAQ